MADDPKIDEGTSEVYVTPEDQDLANELTQNAGLVDGKTRSRVGLVVEKSQREHKIPGPKQERI